MVERITLDQCGKRARLQAMDPGGYVIEYHDGTHLQLGEWIRLLHVEVPHQPALIDDTTESFYTLKKDIGDYPDKPKPGQKAKDGQDLTADYEKRLRTVEDALALAFARIGLLSPEVPDELLNDVLLLDKEDGVVVVPDTNALYNGALHWLLRVLHRPSIWLMPLAVSLTTVQTRDAIVKGLLGKVRPGNVRPALRSRGLVNGALGLLQRNRGRCQVVEIEPSLLRYQKMASSGGTDPDQGDVLEDRLMIEAIHSVMRSMRSRTARRVVTSDVNLARVIEAEGIKALFVPSIALGDTDIGCLHYDPLARRYVGAPLRVLLWELAHVFGSVRLVRDKTVVATLSCYWPGKSPAEWVSETLNCTFLTTDVGEKARSIAPPSSSFPYAHEQTAASEDVAAGTPLEAEEARRAEVGVEESSSISNLHDVGKPKSASLASGRREMMQGGKLRGSIPISSNLPRGSLIQMLHLLDATRRLKGGTVEEIVAAGGESAVAVDTARRAFEILRRAQLVVLEGSRFHTTSDVDIVDTALMRGELDTVSGIFMRFVPYKAFFEALQQKGAIEKRDVVSLLRELVGPVGVFESERLPRYHILLGQAWTDGEVVRDGSNRPTDRDAADAFEAAFRATSAGGLSKVVDLLPEFSRISRMSPWAAKAKIEIFATQRLLPEYSFQPAAGGTPVSQDAVVEGGLGAAVAAPVVIDRVQLGERPVFTIGGPAQ